MYRLYPLATIVLASCLASAADNPAPPPNPNQPPPGEQRDQANNLQPGHENLSYRQRLVTGKVDEVKEIDVSSDGKKTENHLLAKMTTYGGRMVIVDLGPREGLKSEVKAGDELAAFGITGRLNERPLIVASKIATIVPIQGREDVFESIPVSYDNQSENSSNNAQFGKDAINRSNAADAGRPTGETYAPRVNYGPPPFLRQCLDQ